MLANLVVLLGTGLAAPAALQSAGITNEPADRPGSTPPKQTAGRDKADWKIPVSFEPNGGQSVPEVRFLARSPGATAFFTPSEIVLALSGADAPRKERRAPIEAAIGTARIQFLGASPEPELTAGERLRGVVNYIKGNDPALWRTNLPTFRHISYKNLYPGVDLVYEGQESGLKGTYYVDPRFRPSQIKWRYQGAKSVKVDRKGNLQILLDSPGSAGADRDKGMRLTEEKPVAWQHVDGRRHGVLARFKVFADDSVGFSLGRYDPALPLIIDPTLVYSSYLGGRSYDGARDIAVDGAGNAYVVGRTGSTNFPTKQARQPAPPDCTPNAGLFSACLDAFVSKIHSSGTELVYSTYLGGRGPDGANAVWVNEKCSELCPVYIAGDVIGDFPTTTGAYDRIDDFTAGGQADVFVSKLTGDGQTLDYSTRVEGDDVSDPSCEPGCPDDESDIAYDIFADVDQNVAYVTGATSSLEFPRKNPLQEHQGIDDNDDPYDAFVLKMSLVANDVGPEELRDEKDLLFSTVFGGEENDGDVEDEDVATGLQVIGSDIYFSGYTDSDKFPSKVSQTPLRGQPGENLQNGFVAKLKSEGNHLYSLSYSTLFGGCKSDIALDMVLDASGNAYIVGYTESPLFLGEQPDCSDEFDDGTKGFVVGVTSSGFLFPPIFVDGGTAEYVGGVDIDSASNLYLSGYTQSSDDKTLPPKNFFPTTEDAFQVERKGETDAFLIKLLREVLPQESGSEINLSPDDEWLLYSTFLGGSGDEVGFSGGQQRSAHIKVQFPPTLVVLESDPSESAYLSGSTSSSDFPVEPKNKPMQASNGGVTTNGAPGSGQQQQDACREEDIQQDAFNSCDAFVAKIQTVDAQANDEGTGVETESESPGPSPSPSPESTSDAAAAAGSGEESVSSSQSGTPAGTGSTSGGNRATVSSAPAPRGSLPETGLAHGPAMLALGLLLVAVGALMVRLTSARAMAEGRIQD